MGEERVLQGVVFDLDGTLVHSAPDIHAAAQRLLEERGHQGPDLATVIGFVGNGVPKLVERLLDWADEEADAEAHSAATVRFQEIYNAAPSALSSLYEDVAEVLAELTATGLRLGVCTNKPEVPARQVLTDLGIDGYMTAVVGGDSLARRKPDPLPLLHTASALGVSQETVAFIGDSEVDAATASAAGMRFALFTEGYRKASLEEIPHQASFSHYRKLPSLLAGFG